MRSGGSDAAIGAVVKGHRSYLHTPDRLARGEPAAESAAGLGTPAETRTLALP